MAQQAALPTAFYTAVLYPAACFALAVLLAWVWNKRLPKDAPMGLIMSLFLPALGHLYIYKARSLWYVAGLAFLGFVAQGFLGTVYAGVLTSVVSFGLMYQRLVIRRESDAPATPTRHTLTLMLESTALARLHDLCDAMDLSRDEVVARALEALPLESPRP